MIRHVRGVCLLILLAASSFTELNGYPDRGLLGSTSFSQSSSATSNSATGSASAGGEISVSGDSTGVFVATADSELETTAVDQIEELVKGVLRKFPKKRKGTSKKKYCGDVVAFLEEDVTAIATAGVTAATSTFAFVSIDGVGTACADTNAQAKGAATAFARAVLKAWAKAKGRNDSAKAEANLESVIRVLAEASASAASTACITADGTRDSPSFAEAYQNVVAKAYSQAVASILVWLEAFVDCAGTGDGYVDVEVDAFLSGEQTDVTGDAGAKVEGLGNAANEGGGSASTDVLKACSRDSDLGKCCLGLNRNSQNCYCNLLGKKQRPHACKAKKSIVNGVTIWKYTIGKGKKKTKGSCSC